MTNWASVSVLALVTWITSSEARADEPLRHVELRSCAPAVTDFTYLSWAGGWQDRRPASPKVLVVRTGLYGLAVDVEHPEKLRLGRLAGKIAYEDALTEDQRVVLDLQLVKLGLRVKVGDLVYTCVRAAGGQDDVMNFPVRLIEGGRCVHRFDVLNLEFATSTGRKLDAAGRLEFVAWPDRLSVILEVVPKTRLRDAALEIEVTGAYIQRKSASPPAIEWGAGKAQAVGLAMMFDDENEAGEPVVVQARDEHTGKPLAVTYEQDRGWHSVALACDQWSVADDLDRLERVRLVLENPSDRPRTCRLLLAKDAPFGGVTGMTPMILDAAGRPAGIPVQLSKNWHRQPERRMLYEGPWFHGFSILRLPARSTVECRLAITYARWGGVPAASHAQLCLIGWGWNQRWDQSALGSWGESICYEPEAIQQRCMIDDVRPLLVWSMSGDEKRQVKWDWTNNVGGGDFLVYFDGAGHYQAPARMRACYRRAGPNLAATSYAGRSADGKIAIRVDVSLARSDDLVRAFHHFRYDVLAPTSFERLAFYQLGSDHYHWHQYEMAARGDETGLIAEWRPERGGERYVRAPFALTGRVPWLSLHGAIPAVEDGRPARGAWANRGLIVRSWTARLGGRDVPPYAAMFGTNAGGIKSANVELVPPPDLAAMEVGDFVDAEVELLVVPMSASDYYGPDESFRRALTAGANTWKPVLREAAGNHLVVSARDGTVLHTYPLAVAVGTEGNAELDITGGVGYVPVTFTGLAPGRDYKLLRTHTPAEHTIDQSVHGLDFWQADIIGRDRRLERTYNVHLGDRAQPGATVRLRLE